MLPIKTKLERLKVYQIVLEKADLTFENGNGLCCDLRDYSGRNYEAYNSPKGWIWTKTEKYFPEFGEIYKLAIINDELLDEKWRRKTLKKCIKMCKL